MPDESDFDAYEKILKSNLPVAPAGRLSPHDRLADFGLDSLLLLQLVVQLEEAFRIEIPDETLTAKTFETVDSLWLALGALLDPPESFD
ncbi:phosphopantetheine-binding protein [Streptomyces sp. LZ34]